MSRYLFTLALTITLAFGVPDGLPKTGLLLAVWWILFRPLDAAEISMFLAASLVFTAMNALALRQGIFSFAHREILGMPFHETVMWGFYLILFARVSQAAAGKTPSSTGLWFWICLLLFALPFATIQNPTALLAATSLALAFALVRFHQSSDWVAVAFAVFVGIVFELIGVHTGRWFYPPTRIAFFGVPLWSLPMWGGSSFFASRWLRSLRNTPTWVCSVAPNVERREGALAAAEKAFSLGKLRQSVYFYREYLRYEPDAYQRAQVYLTLTRIYRFLVQMKSARLELHRAFQELNLTFPGNSWFSFLAAGFRPADRRPADFYARSRGEQTELLAGLYIELGLSAYYFRQRPLILLASLHSRRMARSSGSSMALLNWYGGSACVFTLFGMKRLSRNLMAKCQRVAQAIQSPRAQGKADIWFALALDYSGDPLGSAKTFSEVLKKYGAVLDPVDVRLCAVTLSVNLMMRGHSRQAMEALGHMRNLHAVFRDSSDYFGFDSATWYAIPALAQLGQTQEVSRLDEAFQSIVSAGKEESWALAQFLGGLLIAQYWSGQLDEAKAEDLIRRFEVVGLRPRTTHYEACFYWIARAYVRSQHLEDPKRAKTFRNELRQLRRLPSHPTNTSHCLVLQARWALHKKRSGDFQLLCERAETFAKKVDNQWALLEIEKLRNQNQKNEEKGRSK